MDSYSPNILLGDCLELFPHLRDGEIDMIVTDPPYGISFESNKQGYNTRVSSRVKQSKPKFFKEIAGDSALPLEWFEQAYRVMKNGAAIYVFCHWSKWDSLHRAMAPLFTVKNMLVLNKSNHGMGDLAGSYAPKHELCLFASKGKHRLRFPNGRSKDVLDVKVKYSGARRKHPNEKPQSWATALIENSTNIGDIVLDPFAGSGSFVREADRLGRVGIGFEVDSQWIDAINAPESTE